MTYCNNSCPFVFYLFFFSHIPSPFPSVHESMTYVIYGPGSHNLEDIILGFLVSVLIVTDVIGNTLVVLVIIKDHSMRTPINYLLLNLAIADLMVGIFCLPSTVLHQFFSHPSGKTGEVLCKLLTGMTMAWMSEMAASFSLMFIAVERYYAVLHPLQFLGKLTIRKTKIFMLVSWGLSALLSIPEFLFTSYKDEDSACEMLFIVQWQGQAYALLWFVITGAAPTIIMFVLYSKVIGNLWFQREKTTNITRHAVLRSRKKISRIMVTVSVVFVLTCIPNHICFVVENYSGFRSPAIGQKILKCLIVLNSAVNPFLYSLQSQQFNKSVKKLFRRTRRKVNVKVPEAIQGSNRWRIARNAMK